MSAQLETTITCAAGCMPLQSLAQAERMMHLLLPGALISSS